MRTSRRSRTTSARAARIDIRPAAVALFALSLLILALSATRAMAWTADEQDVLNNISRKLDSIPTMNGEFVQFGPDGSKTEGKFYIARPGKVRFQYDPPTPISVTSDGKQVLVHDKKLQTYDLWPLSQTPLKFLLDNNLDLASSSRVRHVLIEPDLIQVSIEDDSKFGGGVLTLIFEPESYELKQWTVTDQQGLNTSVAIFNVETGNRLDGKLFKIPYAVVTQANRERQRRK
jgi:outer membrane lipoprotein-sorting protein